MPSRNSTPADDLRQAVRRGNRADAGQGFSLRQIAVTHQPGTAVLELVIDESAEQRGQLRLDRLAIGSRTMASALLEGASGVFKHGSKKKAEIDEDQVKELHAKIGELAVANDFFGQKAQALGREVIRPVPGACVAKYIAGDRITCKASRLRRT